MCRYLAIPLLLLLAGCGAQVLKEGEPNFNTAILLPYPNDPSVSARNIGTLGLTPATLPVVCQVPAAPAAVNVSNCVWAVKAIIDDLYREYRITLHHFADDGNAAADISVLGLTTAATGPIGSSTKTILSGVATLIGGSKSILNQDLLFQKAIEDVINQMDIDRDTQFTTMLHEMQGDNYPIEQAKADLLEYFADGTWDHAIVSLQTTVAAKKAACKAQTDATKVNVAQGTTPPANPAAGAQGAAAAAPAPGAGNTPAGGSTATAPASAGDCGPTTTQAPALTEAAAKAGTIFAVSSGAGYFKVKTAAAPSTDMIAVIYSADGKSFTGAAMNVPFSTFVGWVKPTPVTP
jgi:hypothetical protein